MADLKDAELEKFLLEIFVNQNRIKKRMLERKFGINKTGRILELCEGNGFIARNERRSYISLSEKGLKALRVK